MSKLFQTTYPWSCPFYLKCSFTNEGINKTLIVEMGLKELPVQVQYQWLWKDVISDIGHHNPWDAGLCGSCFYVLYVGWDRKALLLMLSTLAFVFLQTPALSCIAPWGCAMPCHLTFNDLQCMMSTPWKGVLRLVSLARSLRQNVPKASEEALYSYNIFGFMFFSIITLLYSVGN